MGLLAGLAHVSADGADVMDDTARVLAMDAALRHRSMHEPIVAVGNGGVISAAHPPIPGEVLVAVDSPTLSASAVADAYRRHGKGVFATVHGAFAIAIWDNRERTLMLARDRAGIKPLHYALARERLFFASEMRALLTNAEVDRRIDGAALEHYLAFLLTPRDRSIYRGIDKLPPAHYLVLRDGKVTLHEYWRLPTELAFQGTEQEAADELDARLLSACKNSECREQFQATPGVEPALPILLSGLNSSLLTSMTAAISNKRQMTVTVAFEGDEDGEVDVDAARTVARHIDAEHHEVRVRADTQIIERVVSQFDEPFADASAIPMWYLAQSARALGVHCIAGDGDEIVGGCDRYLMPRRVAQFDRVAGRAGRLAAGLGARLLPSVVPCRDFLRHVALNDRGRYVDSMRFCLPDERRALLSPDAANESETRAEERFGAPFTRYTALPWPAQMMAFDYSVELPEDVLAKRDRTAMAHGVECHLPLLDDRVVELVATLPVSMRIREGRLKHILRVVAARYLPASIVDRPKHGFGLSPERWFGTSLRELFGDVLMAQAARQRGLFNRSVIDRLLQEHLTGRRSHTQQLWQLLVFELWHRQQARRPAVAA